MRHKEIRTLQFSRLNLESRIVTVGESKTDASTGRTIPMNADLFAAVVEYMKWYTDRFGTVQPDWYVFPFGKPGPKTPRAHKGHCGLPGETFEREPMSKARFHDTGIPS